jgi:hypothetical protein
MGDQHIFPNYVLLTIKKGVPIGTPFFNMLLVIKPFYQS